MILVCVLAVSNAGHLLCLQGGFSPPFLMHLKKNTPTLKPFIQAVHGICQRAAFLPVDKDKAMSEGVRHWGRAALHATSPVWGAQLS